ncbi:MAG: diguanylate cyclase [Planctomycetaceae bacterium]
MLERRIDKLAETCSHTFELPTPANEDGFLVRISPPGNLSEHLIALTSLLTTLGRDSECDIPLQDGYCSRQHAVIEVRDGRHWLVDRGSRNGTQVNGENVTEQELHVGDQIRFGGYLFKYLTSGNPELRHFREIYQLMTSDSLTHVANRRFFEDCFTREHSRCSRYGRPMGLLLLDFDHFKQVNDQHGHAAGDACLKELCGRVRSAIRQHDLFARLGGDEFAVVLGETRPQECRLVAERIRQRIEADPFGATAGLSLPMTVSIGIACTDGVQLRAVDELLTDADARLYAAKEGGRNCICGPGVPAEVIPRTRDLPAMHLPAD